MSGKRVSGVELFMGGTIYGSKQLSHDHQDGPLHLFNHAWTGIVEVGVDQA